MTGRPTAFPYLGGRSYIHGTSILSGFLDALEDEGASGITVKRMKFQRPAQSNGVLQVTTGSTSDTETAAANAVFVGTAGGETWRGTFAEGGGTPARRVDVAYNITGLTADAFAGRCEISVSDRDDLIRVLIEANKRFHESTLAADASPQVRFGYLENWAAPARDVRLTGELRATNLIAKESGEGWTTINRLTYQSSGRPASLTLCFQIAAPKP